MAEIEIVGSLVWHAPKRCPTKCQLQFQPKIHTVRFVAQKPLEIWEQTPKTLPDQSLLPALSASLLDRFPDWATVLSATTSYIQQNHEIPNE